MKLSVILFFVFCSQITQSQRWDNSQEAFTHTTQRPNVWRSRTTPSRSTTSESYLDNSGVKPLSSTRKPTPPVNSNKWNKNIPLIPKKTNASSITRVQTKGALDRLSTLLTATDSCTGSKKPWSDPELGEFGADENSPYCSASCLRNVFCCVPQQPEDLDVRFVMSTVGDGYAPSRPFFARYADEKLRELTRKDDRPFLWIIHGFLNNYQTDAIFNQTADAYLQRRFNIIVVDWHKGNRLYLQSIANVRVVGALVGQMMDFLDVGERSICAGFSLGSHVCGEAGAFLRARGKLLAKCHGIDPAGPGYDGCGGDIRLDPSDCGQVTSIHTSQFISLSSLLGEQGLGTKFKTGHCDFWMNHGLDQPLCDNTTFPSLFLNVITLNFGKLGNDVSHAIACSHSRGMNYYLSQVTKSCHFKGIEGECGGGTTCVRSSSSPRSRRGILFTSISTTTPQSSVSTASDEAEERRGVVNFVKSIFRRGSSTTTSTEATQFEPTSRPTSRPTANLWDPFELSFEDAPHQMSLSPDDNCKKEYNVDYKVRTTGKPPYC